MESLPFFLLIYITWIFSSFAKLTLIYIKVWRGKCKIKCLDMFCFLIALSWFLVFTDPPPRIWVKLLKILVILANLPFIVGSAASRPCLYGAAKRYIYQKLFWILIITAFVTVLCEVICFCIFSPLLHRCDCPLPTRQSVRFVFRST